MRNATNPLFKGQRIYGEHLSVAFLAQKSLQMNKNQWAIGFSVLELSKLVMGELFYEVIQPRFGANNIDLLMTDTDSFLLHVRTKLSEEECMRKLGDVMDFSNYPKDHPLYDPSRAKELGLLKNEKPAKEIVSFVGLKSKSYAIRVAGGSEEVKAKGVPYRSKKHIPLTAMLDCLRRISSHDVTFRRIGSKNHEIRLTEMQRRAFSSFDDKRFLFCCQHSAPYGSKFIAEFYREGEKCPFCRRIWDAIKTTRRTKRRKRKQSAPACFRPQPRITHETPKPPPPPPPPPIPSPSPPLSSSSPESPLRALYPEEVVEVLVKDGSPAPSTSSLASAFDTLDLDIMRDLGLDDSVFDVAMQAVNSSWTDLDKNA